MAKISNKDLKEATNEELDKLAKYASESEKYLLAAMVRAEKERRKAKA